MATFPGLRLRDPAIDLVELPWEQPLAEWSPDRLACRHDPAEFDPGSAAAPLRDGPSDALD